jgi:hypothetical protein
MGGMASARDSTLSTAVHQMNKLVSIGWVDHAVESRCEVTARPILQPVVEQVSIRVHAGRLA